MKLPFISRAEHERSRKRDISALLIAKGEGNYIRRLLDEERAERKRLTDAVLEMRRDGFSVPVASGPQPEREVPLPSIVEAALDDIGLTGQARSEAEAYARRCMAQEMEPEAIRTRLYDGEQAATEDDE